MKKDDHITIRCAGNGFRVIPADNSCYAVREEVVLETKEGLINYIDAHFSEPISAKETIDDPPTNARTKR